MSVGRRVNAVQVLLEELAVGMLVGRYLCVTRHKDFKEIHESSKNNGVDFGVRIV